MLNIFNKHILGFIAICLLLSSCKTISLNTNSKPSSSLNQEEKTRISLVNYAHQLEGTPYKVAGKDPKGFDCSGFTAYVYMSSNIQLSPSSKLQAQQGKEIPVEKAKEGDLLFFGRNGRSGEIMHVGLVSKNKPEGIFMIHSSSSKGVIETNVTTSEYWKPKLLFARTVFN